MKTKDSKNLRIALIHVLNSNVKYSANKDLNGGYGTADDIGSSFFFNILASVRKRSIRIPILSFAFLQQIFKQQGHNVEYFEGKLPENEFDIYLIYGSIIDYKYENYIARLLKQKYPEAKVGFIGPFPTKNSYLFSNADFVILGEPESFFMNDFKELNQLSGDVSVSSLADLNSMPSPCFDGFPIKEYSYEPMNSRKPFLFLQSSKGCPYSCKFYCTYGELQGNKIRLRSHTKIVDDIVHVQKKYGIKGIQFRDPTFGLDRNYVLQLCDELKRRDIRIEWGIETRLDLLDENIINKMFEVGLRNINVGIETSDISIAKKNKRKLIDTNHQKKIIKFCKKIGIKVSAFYLLALEDDTEESIENTIKYSIKLNTNFARFAIVTPFPGTGFFDKLEKENRILTKDYEKYTQYNLVYKHNNLSPERVKEMLGKAYKKYYLRPSFFYGMIKWKIREFWL